MLSANQASATASSPPTSQASAASPASRVRGADSGARLSSRPGTSRCSRRSACIDSVVAGAYFEFASATTPTPESRCHTMNEPYPG